MTAEELARRVQATAQAAADRVRGIGAAQYDRGGEQRFEGLPLTTLVREAREEAQDLVAWAVMVDIRLQRLEQALDAAPAAAAREHRGLDVAPAAAAREQIAREALERIAIDFPLSRPGQWAWDALEEMGATAQEAG